MANKRVFSVRIVRSDAFLDMPISTQNLYFQLNMEADNEGFVGNPKQVQRMVGASGDDLKVLIAKRFVLIFESGVVVIKHWLIHNTLSVEKYGGTSYQEERKQLIVKENKAYTEVQAQCKHSASKCIAGASTIERNRIEKKGIEKNRIEIVAKRDTPYSLKEEIKKLEDNPRREMNIIALYFDYRKPDLRNYEQYQLALKRHLKSAKQLVDFTDEQILKAIKVAEKEYKEVYTLETLIKVLTK